VPTVQHRFDFARPLSVRVRSVRRPFHPSRGEGSYRLPRDVQERLAAALAPFRNRDAAYALAVFIARFWSVPGRVAGAFPIDRRALADHGDLELTEARVRGAIRVLEEIGFLDRALASGSRYKPTEEGLRRKPILFVIGSDYAVAFIAANKRAAAARGGQEGVRRPQVLASAPRPPLRLPEGSLLKSPKSKNPSERSVLMGEVRKKIGIPPTAFEPNSHLEAALERLKKAIGEAGALGSPGSVK
jgi:hypothetical protein